MIHFESDSEEHPAGVRLEGRSVNAERSGCGWQFIDLAGLGRNTGRSYAAALLRIVLYPLAVAVLLGLAVALGAVVGRPQPGSMDPIVGILIQYGLIVEIGR